MEYVELRLEQVHLREIYVTSQDFRCTYMTVKYMAPERAFP